MSARVRAYLLDDEEPGLKNLAQLIQRFLSEEVEIAGMSQQAIRARAEVESMKPDLLFLDIQMPGLTGFDFLSTFSSIDFEVVFVTAHQEYALQAIKAGALDYVLKPVSIEDLRQAIVKYRKKHPGGTRPAEENHRLALPRRSGYALVPVSDVMYVHGEDNYSRVFLHGGECITVARTLKDFEERLGPPQFFRIHKSHLVHLGHVNEYSAHDGGYVIMKDGARLAISRRRMQEFRSAVDSYLLGHG